MAALKTKTITEIFVCVCMLISAKTAEPTKTMLGILTDVASKSHVLDGCTYGTIWQKRLNDHCSAAMRAVTTVINLLNVQACFAVSRRNIHYPDLSTCVCLTCLYFMNCKQ